MHVLHQQPVPLKNIIAVSPLNPRANAPARDIEQLAAAIAETDGPRQAIVLRPLGNAEDEFDGQYEVLIGRRRWLALKHLAATSDDVRWNHPEIIVHCDILNAEDIEAEKISLLEQENRLPLSPAEQVKAFADLRLRGLEEAEIAQMFALSPRVVRQRIALGGLSPKVLAALESGQINMEAARAFSANPSHAEQEKLFDANPGWRNDPHSIRHALRGKAVRSNEPIAKFVGLELYQQNGGMIDADLFTEDAWLVDAHILRTLAVEKLDAEGERLKRAEAWGYFCNDANSTIPRGQYRLAEDAQPNWTKVDEEKLDALEAECVAAPPGQIKQIETEIAALHARAWTRGVPLARRKKLCVWIAWDHDGNFDIERGLELIPDAKDDAAESFSRKAGEGGAIGRSEERPSSPTDDEPDDGDATDATSAPEKPAPIAPALRAQTIRDALEIAAAQAALQTLIAENDSLALGLASVHLWDNVRFMKTTPFGAPDLSIKAPWMNEVPVLEAGLSFDRTCARLSLAIVSESGDGVIGNAGRAAKCFCALLASSLRFKADTPREVIAAMLDLARDCIGAEPVREVLAAAFDYPAWFHDADKALCDAALEDLGDSRNGVIDGKIPNGRAALRAHAATLCRRYGWLPELLRNAAPDDAEAEA